jgi:hypothetical protein
MNAFEAGKSVEQRSREILHPFIQQRAFNGQFVVTSKGPLARELQRSVGDLLYNTDAETVYSAEMKAEEENKWGRFFLEMWSNREWFTPGWMIYLKTDLLLYHFLKEDLLYPIPFMALRKWAFHRGRIYAFPERQQSKYKQANDTWGRCVPIEILVRELNLGKPFSPAAFQYDAADDLKRSVEEGFSAIRERKANGGPGWTPKSLDDDVPPF